MARYDHLPIWKDAVALTALLEEVVRRLDASHPWFARYAQPPVAQIRSGRICPRYHKYALGADLRRQAYAVCRGVVVANGERGGRLAAVERLVLAVEELKLLIQMGKEVRAFASFQEFERAAELAGLLRSLRRLRQPNVLVLERGYLKTGFKRRVFHSLWWPALQAVTSPSYRLSDEINPHPQPLSQRARGAQGTDHGC